MENFINKKEQMRLALEKINNYLKDGFVLHGSKIKREILNPQKAQDNDPNRSHVGQQLAVYAEDTDPRIPILMALRDRKNKLKPLSDMGYSCIDRGTMYVTGENLGFTNGYISVLKKDTFTILEDKEADEREVVSFEPVKPVDNIEISSEILELLENIKYDIKD